MKNNSVFGYKPDMELKLNRDEFHLRIEEELNPFSLGLICATISGGTDFLPSTAPQVAALIRSVMDDCSIELEEIDIEQFMIGFMKGLEVFGFSRDYAIHWSIFDDGEILSEETSIFKVYKTEGVSDRHLCITVFTEEDK